MKILIRVKTGASKNQIVKNDETNWDIFVTSLPHEGKANKAVIELLAKDLGVSKSRIEIIKGSKSKLKAVEIHNF